MYRRERFRVNCADLGLPREQWTKELSYRQANRWWEGKKKEIDGRTADAHPHAQTIAELARKLEYARQHGLQDEATSLSGQMEEVEAVKPADDFASIMDPGAMDRMEAARLLGVVIPPDLDHRAVDMLFGDGRVWQDRFKRAAAVPADRTIGEQAEVWAGQKVEEARGGVRSASGVHSQQCAIAHFVAYAGASTPVEGIDFDLWQRWYVFCSRQMVARDEGPGGWRADYAQKVFSVARSFVRWLYERGVLPALPRNLASRKYTFERPATAIPTFSDEEVRTLLGNRNMGRMGQCLRLESQMSHNGIINFWDMLQWLQSVVTLFGPTVLVPSQNQCMNFSIRNPDGARAWQDGLDSWEI